MPIVISAERIEEEVAKRVEVLLQTFTLGKEMEEDIKNKIKDIAEIKNKHYAAGVKKYDNRRYEIAKVMIVEHFYTGNDCKTAAKEAVRWADALIDELDR